MLERNTLANLIAVHESGGRADTVPNEKAFELADAIIALDKTLVPEAAPKKKKKKPSRADRWNDAVSEASEALDAIEAAASDFESAVEELTSVQQEYAEWKDNLPENLANSVLGEKLSTVSDISIEDLASTITSAVEEVRSTLEEAESADLPQGFGRD